MTYFFAKVNSSFWIDILDTTKTNIDRHTWRLQQPQSVPQQGQNNLMVPSIHLFDLQTATAICLHTIEFRYTLNRQHLQQKHLTVTLYRYSTEQNDVDQKVEFNQLNSSSNFSKDDILAGPYSLIDYLESPVHDHGLIQICSQDLLNFKSKRFRLVLESKLSANNSLHGQSQIFPIEIVSITLRSARHSSRLLRLYDATTIDCLMATILNTNSEKKIIYCLNLLISIIYTTNDPQRLNRIKELLLNEAFLRRTFIQASRTLVKRTATLILMIGKRETQIETFIESFLNLFELNENFLLGFQSASGLKWFFVLIGHWIKYSAMTIEEKLLKWLLQLADLIRKTDDNNRRILRNK